MKKKIAVTAEEWEKLQAIDRWDAKQLVLTILNTAYGPFGYFNIYDIRIVENSYDNIVVWLSSIDDHDSFVNISLCDADMNENAFVLIDVYRYDGAPITIEYEGTREDKND